MTYMEKMDSYTLMDTKIMDRIVKELWNTDIDVSGNFLDQSTSIKLYNEPKLELETRFYRNDTFTKKTHLFILRVWTESLGARYEVELLCYTIFTTLNIYLITNFCA